MPRLGRHPPVGIERIIDPPSQRVGRRIHPTEIVVGVRRHSADGTRLPHHSTIGVVNEAGAVADGIDNKGFVADRVVLVGRRTAEGIDYRNRPIVRIVRLGRRLAGGIGRGQDVAHGPLF